MNPTKPSSFFAATLALTLAVAPVLATTPRSACPPVPPKPAPKPTVRKPAPPKAVKPPHVLPKIGVRLAGIDAFEATAFDIENDAAKDAVCSRESAPKAEFQLTVTEGQTRKVLSYRVNVATAIRGATPIRFKAVQVVFFKRVGRCGWTPLAKAYCGEAAAFGPKAPEAGSLELQLTDARGTRLEDNPPVLAGKSAGCFKVMGEADARLLAYVTGTMRAEVTVATACAAKHAHSGAGRQLGSEWIDYAKSAFEFRPPKIRRINDKVLLTQWLFARPDHHIAGAGHIRIQRETRGTSERCGNIPASGRGAFTRRIQATGKSGTRWTFKSWAPVRFRPAACGSTTLGTVAFLIGRGGCPSTVRLFNRTAAVASVQLLARGCEERARNARRARRGHGHRCGSSGGTPPTTPPAGHDSTDNTPPATQPGTGTGSTPPAGDDSEEPTAPETSTSSPDGEPPVAPPDASADTTPTAPPDAPADTTSTTPPLAGDDDEGREDEDEDDEKDPGESDDENDDEAPAPGTTVSTGDFQTFTQGGWGSRAHGNNPGSLRDSGFAAVFPAGLTIGSGNLLVTFRTSAAVEAFLPAGGSASVLRESALDPESTAAGVLAGQLVAATLNAAFSASGRLEQADSTPLGSLTVAAGSFAGLSVDALLAAANRAIAGDNGGLPPGATISDLNDALTRINECFDNGTVNTGYLRRP
ncbi:MAG: hypothetical protein HYY25_03105 [Candidatus Wallbacteria bacterium]|nr:hypothetical protein [Candidatus Wallbacteria bacterium]